MAKKLWVVVPLVTIVAVQMFRVECVAAPPQATRPPAVAKLAVPTSQSTVAQAGYDMASYVIEPPDVLSIGLITTDAVSKYEADDFVTDSLVVDPDGTVDLGKFGKAYVNGMTVAEARDAIKKQFLAAKRFKGVDFDLRVEKVNSKVVYLVHQDKQDCVQRIPCKPGMTVADAFHWAVWSEPIEVTAAKIWVARPAPRGVGLERILPVKWEDVVFGKPSATNYELLPGDRLFVNTKEGRDYGVERPQRARVDAR